MIKGDEGMIRLEWLFFMQLVMGILMIIFLRKLIQIKKQMDTITKEVMNYISYVTEDIEKEQYEEKLPQKLTKKEDEEAQNRLIQAVLGEYFT